MTFYLQVGRWIKRSIAVFSSDCNIPVIVVNPTNFTVTLSHNKPFGRSEAYDYFDGCEAPDVRIGVGNDAMNLPIFHCVES